MGEPNVRFGSYIQGVRETYEEIGLDVPPGYREGDSCSINEDRLDMEQYQRGQISALTDILRSVVCRGRL